MKKVPEYTANYLLGIIALEEAARHGEPVFGFIDDERALKTAARRGLAERVENKGWRLTPACYEWAKQYRRRHLKLIPGGSN
jgi:hypothetical protein